MRGLTLPSKLPTNNIKPVMDNKNAENPYNIKPHAPLETKNEVDSCPKLVTEKSSKLEGQVIKKKSSENRTVTASVEIVPNKNIKVTLEIRSEIGPLW